VVSDTHLGTLTHRVIADLLHEGHRSYDPEATARAVASALPTGLGVFAARRVRQQLLTRCGVYFERFAPPEGWDLLGTEVAVGDYRADHIWRDGQSAVIDELKTGASWSAFSVLETFDRAQTIADRGVPVCGFELREVRVLVFATPQASATFRCGFEPQDVPLGGAA
jgi:hypothetical protein